MKTETLKQTEMQRFTQADSDVPERVAGAFIHIKCDLSVAAQQQPEMTDEEVLAANQTIGGFNWLNDPQEDVY